MDKEELKDRAKFFTRLIWGKELDCEVVVNKRLKSTLGQFVSYGNDRKPKRIEIANNILAENKFFVIDTLIHELTHWYLHLIDKDYRDGSKTFEDELRRIGVNSTETTRLRKQGTTYLRDIYVYQCSKCKLELRITKNNDDGYGCWRCGEQMQLRGLNQLEEIEFTPSSNLIGYELEYMVNNRVCNKL